MAPAAQAALGLLSQRERLLRALLAGLALPLALLLLLVAAPLALLSGGGSGGTSAGGLPAGAAPFLAIYADAALVYRVSPFLLMAVHEDETGFGSSTLPGVRSGVNSAGCCAGPMQFLITGGATPAAGGRGGTWAGYRSAHQRARLPRPESYPLRFERPHPNVYDSYDAIYAAAAYLRALGAGPRLDERTLRALARYKGTPPASLPYARYDFQRARELEQLARRGAGGEQGTPAPVPSGELGWPLPRPYTQVISPFGTRWGRLHAGVDIPAPQGTRIYAAATGRVTTRGWVGGYGNYTCLQHRGAYSTCYAHQSRLGPTPSGGIVTRGALVGYVGCTGHCFGDHLHFELRVDGRPVDPEPYLRGRR